MRPSNWVTPTDSRYNIITSVSDDILMCLIDLRCPGEPSRSQRSLLVANSRGWRPFVGSDGCELQIMVRKPLLGAHPDVLASLGKDYEKIYKSCQNLEHLPRLVRPDDKS